MLTTGKMNECHAHGDESIRKAGSMCEPSSDSSNQIRAQVNLEKNVFFQCDKCEEHFINFQQLNSHRVKHIEELHCDKCDQCFLDFKELCSHRAKHFEAEYYEENTVTDFEEKQDVWSRTQHTTYLCDVWNKTLSSESRRDETSQVDNARESISEYKSAESVNSQRDDKLKCDKCEKEFSNFKDLCAHRATHFEEKQNVGLAVCGINVQTSPDLNQHEALCLTTDEKSDMCEFCGHDIRNLDCSCKHTLTFYRGDDTHENDIRDKTLPTINQLAHNAVKSYTKRHSCDDCGKSFHFPLQLTQHRYTHTGERPFKCDTCQKGFRSKSHLNVHKVMHSNEKTHMCDTCGKYFGLKWNLTKHKRVHTGEKPYNCDSCDISFTHHQTLRYHRSKIHNGMKS